jgi:hypothetical protein
LNWSRGRRREKGKGKREKGKGKREKAEDKAEGKKQKAEALHSPSPISHPPSPRHHPTIPLPGIVGLVTNSLNFEGSTPVVCLVLIRNPGVSYGSS